MNLKHIILTTILVLLMCSTASAANCGGATPCNCGDTVIEDYTLTADLTGCSGHGLLIGASNIVIDGDGHTISGSGNSNGIRCIAHSNVTIKNMVITNFERGIYFSSSPNCTLNNNTIGPWNHYGIYVYSSSDNTTIINNTIIDGTLAIKITVSSNTDITNNVVLNNGYVLLLQASSGNTYSNNQFLHNLGDALFTFVESDREKNVGDSIDFNFSMSYLNDTSCPSCDYGVSVSPYESISNLTKTGNRVTGDFIVTRSGIYSLNINITDTDDNTAKRKLLFFINCTEEEIVKYYFRYVPMTHGQPNGTDATSLMFTSPTTDESWTCGTWIQNSPDELPDYPLSLLKKINFYTLYTNDAATGYFGTQRYTDIDPAIDRSTSVPQSTEYAWIEREIGDINWTMDYTWSWYRISLKHTGTSPTWKTNTSQMSYANFTYNYSTTPTVKSITNPDIRVLSATSPASDATNATIVVDGTGSTCLVVQMPNTTLTYTATWDDGACTGGDCSFTQSSGELNFTLTLGSEHTINISEASAGTNNIILAANKYGMLRKDVTAAQTFSTIASGFAHGVCFTWWDDVTDTWKSYWTGDTYNSAQSVPEHESYFVLMDGTGENVSCSVAEVENVNIPIGWSSTYLRESASKTLTAIKSDMGGNCADLYAWDHTASGTGAWTNTGSFSVLPNQGLLVSASSPFTWDGDVP